MKPQIPFLDLPLENLGRALLLIDVDGTLVPDHGGVLAKEPADKLRALAHANSVYLCSNGSPEHAKLFARELGIGSLPCWKPLPGRARALVRGASRAIVIGDKCLTDGLYAWALGAEFIKVARVESAYDPLFMRLGYRVDDALWSLYTTLFSPRQA